MSVRTGLDKAYKIMGGKSPLANELGISYQSMNRWYDYNEMPATEYNGKTDYSKQIEKLTGGKVTIEELCGFVPHPQSEGWKK